MPVIETRKALERFDNEREIYLELVDTFLDLKPVDFSAIRKELDAGHADEVIHRIHQLKGAVLTLGAEKLAGSAALLENGLRNGTEKAPLEILGRIEAEYNEAVAELGIIRDNLRKLP